MSRTVETKVELEGVEVGLRLDYNAVALIEDTFPGRDLTDLSVKSPRDVRALVYACASAYDTKRGTEPRFSLMAIGGLITIESAQALADPLLELLGMNMPDAPEAPAAGEDGANPPAAPETDQASA